MRIRRMIVVFVVNVLILAGMPMMALAANDTDTKQKEDEGKQINQELGDTLNAVNEKYKEVDVIKAEISNKERSIKDTNAEIKQRKASVDERLAQAKERLKDLQGRNASQSMLDALLNSESITDFVGRAYALTVLQKADNAQVSNLQSETQKLADLKIKLASDTKTLKENKVAAETEAADLDKKVGSLKDKVAANKEAIASLANNKKAEEKRAADAKAANSAKPVQVSTAGSTGMPSFDQPMTAGAGQSITVRATAYSYAQPGLSTHTATGIDLTQNPNVIAVDPSVIPLGSTVEVPGYGIAIAGDTGGFSGNTIDVHFPTVAQAHAWGTRTITIKVLN